MTVAIIVAVAVLAVAGLALYALSVRRQLRQRDAIRNIAAAVPWTLDEARERDAEQAEIISDLEEDTADVEDPKSVFDRWDSSGR